MNKGTLPHFSSIEEEVAYLREENTKLKKINSALIFRVEEGGNSNAGYAAFENSVHLAVQVNQKTLELNEALAKLQGLNHRLSEANNAANVFKQRFIDAIESITEAFVLLDKNGNIILQNSIFQRFWENSELMPMIGSNYYELKSLGKSKGIILSVTPNSGQTNSVYHLNNDRWYQLNERSTQDGGMVLLFTDITHLKQAESRRYKLAIAKKNALLQNLIDNLTQGLLLLDKDETPEVWNAQFERFCDCSSEKIQNSKHLQNLTAFTEVDLLPKNQNFVHIQELNNGTVIDVRRHYLPDGKSIITILDITERYQYELSLKESENWLRMITDNVPAMIAYVNNQKQFMFTNKVYKQWYGGHSEDLIGKSLEQSKVFDDYEGVESYINRALNGETVTYECREYNRANEEVYLLKSYVPNISEKGEVLGFFVLINDITERINAAQALQNANLELEERVQTRTQDLENEIENRKAAQLSLSDAIRAAEMANESKSKFLAAVSHDLLQPLNAAQLFAASLLNVVDKNNEHILNAIKSSLTDLENLIVTLVDISKLDAGVINPDKQVFALNSLLENISTDYEKISLVHDIEFTFIPTSVYVETDSLLLARILRNYLSNAVRYAKGKKVTLGCRRRNNHVEIQVWDTGVGIAQENLAEIYKEFKRLKGAVQAQQSLGLGLAIVEKMAKVLGHSIGVKSELGKGSCFTVTLPIQIAPLINSSNTQGNALLNNHLFGAKVWMVDNDPAICKAMRALLQQWGCEVTTALSYQHLAEFIDPYTDDCDLLLLDYHLDDEQTGIMVAQQINQNRRAALPIIMISANYKQELQEQCKENNILLLNKPVKPLKLRMSMQQCLNRQPY
jgi:PAS domain S-box-containing protein